MKYLYFFILLLLLAACDAIISEPEQAGPVDPQQLLLEINDQRRFISTDQVADLLINQDPSLLLIDVREEAAFQNFALPQSINIPLESFLNEAAQNQIDCNKYNIVFYSYDDIQADQAWILQRNQGCQNIHVLKGGLNKWTQTIIQPEEPAQTAGSDAWELFDFRIAARKYFTGGATELEPLPYLPPQRAAVKTITLKPKKVQKEEEEGC